ncbi:MAG: chromosome partitioning protein ParB, partial [Roseibium sp.]
DADTKALEKRLADTLGLKVSVGHKPGKESGDLKIKYTSLEQLDELCRKLGVETG